MCHRYESNAHASKFEKLLKSVGLAHQKLLYTHHARMCLDEIVGNLNKKTQACTGCFRVLPTNNKEAIEFQPRLWNSPGITQSALNGMNWSTRSADSMHALSCAFSLLGLWASLHIPLPSSDDNWHANRIAKHTRFRLFYQLEHVHDDKVATGVQP